MIVRDLWIKSETSTVFWINTIWKQFLIDKSILTKVDRGTRGFISAENLRSWVVVTRSARSQSDQIITGRWR